MLRDGPVRAPQWPARGQCRPVSAAGRPAVLRDRPGVLRDRRSSAAATGRASSATGPAVLPRRAGRPPDRPGSAAATGRVVLPGQTTAGRERSAAAWSGVGQGRPVRAGQSAGHRCCGKPSGAGWPVSAPRQVSEPPRRPDEPQCRGDQAVVPRSDGAAGPGMSAGSAGPAGVRLVRLSVMGVLMIPEAGQRYPLTDCRSNESGIAAWPQCPDPPGPSVQRPAEAGRAGQR